ncbi:S-adenosylmethionine synthase [Pseudoclavibacter endophyticus]|uniref:S-adenosylmethionine synthase n=1 Tax=Pseudoclavibacter endophyticus TaxID=1778590 RepID=A0A6H9WTT7_9MICO|nr:methionine adenosyltransferase [Pseudoclavibacter endophyticus]KAB1650095.1 methionine adenosyltransferase [Pseudoclavibacter endophyticus]GGA57312.1 S-adenosylmethionine synthase [Pseudoclavibacter endophyticus]
MPELRTFTSESVTEGHPDKICDQISDSILDALLTQDPDARVALETLVTTGQVHVAGEVATAGYADIAGIVRRKISEIGYTSSDVGFDGRSCGVSISVGEQSKEIAEGVETSLEHREGSADELQRLGAGDQGIMFGYASNETPVLMPAPVWLAHRLSERLARVRKDGTVPYLRPDGKTQVTLGYEGSIPRTVETIVVSTQHNPGIPLAQITNDVEEHVIRPVLQRTGFGDATPKVLVNPSGSFIDGGPRADAGLTGRKIIVDTYGGMARHGGGAFSGKDPSKVDRSGAYAMRWVAKNIVAAGLADRVELQVAYAIGQADPVGLYLETFDSAHADVARIEAAVREVFDLRPAAIIRDLSLKRPIYTQTAAYGHFGRELPEFTWERTDRVEDLRREVGV